MVNGLIFFQTTQFDLWFDMPKLNQIKLWTSLEIIVVISVLLLNFINNLN